MYLLILLFRKRLNFQYQKLREEVPMTTNDEFQYLELAVQAVL